MYGKHVLILYHMTFYCKRIMSYKYVFGCSRPLCEKNLDSISGQ